MIEVGLVAGRMGRARVALCTSGSVDLPSDLNAVTRIEDLLVAPDSPILENEKTVARKNSISTLALSRLGSWVTVVPAILQGVPCTRVLHGYSGHWRVVLEFEKWRTRVVGTDFAGLNADILLHIPCEGLAGSGMLVGKLTLNWKPGGDREQAYTGLFHVCSAINDATCRADGSMTLRTQTLMRQAILESGNPSSGDALPEGSALGGNRWQYPPRRRFFPWPDDPVRDVKEMLIGK